MSRPVRRPTRDRVRRRPVYDTFEGRFSAGSLLAWPALRGMAFPSVRPVAPVGDHQTMGIFRAHDLDLAGSALRRPGASNAPPRPGSIIPARPDSTRTPTPGRPALAPAVPSEDGVPSPASSVPPVSQVIASASP